MACENAETNLYMYHLLSNWICQEDLRYRKQVFGKVQGLLSQRDFLMIEEDVPYYKTQRMFLEFK